MNTIGNKSDNKGHVNHYDDSESNSETDPIQYSCDSCNFITNDRTKYQCHIQSDHTVNCEYCDQHPIMKKPVSQP